MVDCQLGGNIKSTGMWMMELAPEEVTPNWLTGLGGSKNLLVREGQ